MAGSCQREPGTKGQQKVGSIRPDTIPCLGSQKEFLGAIDPSPKLATIVSKRLELLSGFNDSQYSLMLALVISGVVVDDDWFGQGFLEGVGDVNGIGG